MAHPIYTEEDRIAARRATWRKYNHAHTAERAAHNKEYVQKENVKGKSLNESLEDEYEGVIR